MIALAPNTWTKIPSVTVNGFTPGNAVGDVRWAFHGALDLAIVFGCDGLRNADTGHPILGSAEYRRTSWGWSPADQKWRCLAPDVTEAGQPAGRCQPAIVYHARNAALYFMGYISRRQGENIAQGYPEGSVWRSTTGLLGWRWQDLKVPKPQKKGTDGVWRDDVPYAWNAQRHIVYSTHRSTVLAVIPDPWLQWYRIYALNETGVNPATGLPGRWDLLTWTGGPPNREAEYLDEQQGGPCSYDPETTEMLVTTAAGMWLFNDRTLAWRRAAACPAAFVKYMPMKYLPWLRKHLLLGAGTGYDKTCLYSAETNTWEIDPVSPPLSIRKRAGSDTANQMDIAVDDKRQTVYVYGNDPDAVCPVWACHLVGSAVDRTPPPAPSMRLGTVTVSA